MKTDFEFKALKFEYIFLILKISRSIRIAKCIGSL